MASAAITFAALLSHERTAVAAGLRRRDPDLLDLLIDRYQYRLFRYLLYLTGSREIAEDLFQETWVRVLDRGHQYDGKAAFGTWLFSIARHLAIDLQRRKTFASLDSRAGEDAGPEVQFPSSGPSPHEIAAGLERDSNLREAVGRLPAIFREVLVLRFQEEMPIEEIAAVLEAPVSTVKSRLYRGLEALRSRFAGGNV